jgi:NAD(P)-dependent dehydrogenase (short-subunit alcohol dehydrogenase family)
VVVVTGAGRGIGAAIARLMAKHGSRVVVNDFGVAIDGSGADAGPAEQVVREIVDAGGEAAASADSVSDWEGAGRIVQCALDRFGRIDAVVNNVGLAPVAKVDELSVEQWHAVINTNLSSAFYLARAVWGTFKEQRGGCIVNISSMASRDPLPGFLAYGAAKAGLNLLSLVLAREGAEYGIRSYAIAPGAVETSMFRRMVSKEKWPVEKTLEPADVARVVAQCIDGDLKYASGEVIFLSKTV